jgi:hypothetical protein
MALARAERPETGCGALATAQAPPAVRANGMATRPGRGPVRRRGGGGAAPLTRRRPAPPLQAPAGASTPRPRGRAQAPLCSDAVQDARHAAPWWRLGPGWSRAAPGAPTPLPEPGRTGRLAHTVSRRRRSETARANVWADPLNALPWPWVVARRATARGPSGVRRSKRPAASEQARVRAAVPRCVPAGPSRVPADALAHLTRRP